MKAGESDGARRNWERTSILPHNKYSFTLLCSVMLFITLSCEYLDDAHENKEELFFAKAANGQCARVDEGSTAVISCPTGTIITSVDFASYGTPSGSCPNFSQGTCHASSSKSKVESLCLNKQSCSVRANNGVFGDPCVGTFKELAVTFECRSVGDSTGKCAEITEFESKTISCPDGKVIDSIDYASYGLPEGSCDRGFSNGRCHSQSSKSEVEAVCLGKNSCTLAAENDIFGDPCPGNGKKLAVTYSCVDGDGDDGDGSDGMPVFLLAGQSNMVGNVDRDLFNQLMSELESGSSGTRQQRLVERLRNWYQNFDSGYASYGYSAQIVELEASELIRLNQADFVNSSITQPYQKVLCSNTSAAPQALALSCGNPFGPELALGRVLGKTNHAPTSLIKVAKGGTTLYSDWLPPSAANRTGRPVGALYKQLRERIKSLGSNPASVHPNCASQKCRWGAFIWFQGENDSMGQAEAGEYQKNLANLISDVRSEIGSSELPVIVVGIGRWAQKDLDHGTTVLAAQKAVVNADSQAKFVPTDDLSGYYHYDPAAQLIIGERVGKALLPMLNGTADACPNDPNKTQPGQCGCGVPEGSCDGQGGLKGTYFNNQDLTDQALVRTDATVNFNWSRGAPDPRMDGDTFSVRWTGFVKPKYTQTYTFYTFSDDGVRLWINDKLVINNWTDHSETEDRGTISLQAGKSYPIKMEYFESGGDAVAKLLWSSPSQTKQVIPKEQLSTDFSNENGIDKCVQEDEGNNANLYCSGGVITKISFASYGTPTGTCPHFAIGTCHASNSLSKVRSLCLNKQSCNIEANNSVFDDPCAGVGKKLAIAYTCNGDDGGDGGDGGEGSSYNGSGRLLRFEDHKYILSEVDADEADLLKREGFTKKRIVSVGNWTKIFTVQATSLVDDKVLMDIAVDAEYLLRPIVERYPDRLRKVLDRKGGTFNVLVVYGSGWGLSGGMGDGPQVYKRWGAYGGGLHHEMGHIFDLWSASNVFRSHVDSILSAEDAAVLDRHCGNTLDPRQDFEKEDGGCLWSEFIAEQYHWMSFPETRVKVQKNLPEVYQIILKYIPEPSNRVPALK